MIEVTRSGAAVAPPAVRLLPAERFRELIATAPALDDHLADEVRALRQTVIGEQEHAISVITVSEPLHGVHRAPGARRAQCRAFVEHLLPGLRAIPITDSVARVHAEIWRNWPKAATSLALTIFGSPRQRSRTDYSVASRNQTDFHRVPGLRVIAIS